MAQSHKREFTLGPLNESRRAPGGRRLVGQAVNLSLSLHVGCYVPNIHASPCLIEVDTHLPSFGGWKAESTYALRSVCSPCPKLRIAVIFVTNKLSAARVRVWNLWRAVAGTKVGFGERQAMMTKQSGDQESFRGERRSHCWKAAGTLRNSCRNAKEQRSVPIVKVLKNAKMH